MSENPAIDDAALDTAVTTPVAGLVAVQVRSDLDLLTSPAFEHLLDDELAARPGGLLIDLSRCDFIGSPGLALLVAVHGRAESAGIWFALAALSPATARALAVVGLSTAFAVHATVAESVGAFLDARRDTP